MYSVTLEKFNPYKYNQEKRYFRLSDTVFSICKGQSHIDEDILSQSPLYNLATDYIPYRKKHTRIEQLELDIERFLPIYLECNLDSHRFQTALSNDDTFCRKYFNRSSFRNAPYDLCKLLQLAEALVNYGELKLLYDDKVSYNSAEFAAAKVKELAPYLF